nr:alpha/beta hydrolase [Metabacillus kandeliae]
MLTDKEIRQVFRKVPFIKIRRNVTLHYELKGSGHPIVFIHPTGMGLKTFSYQEVLSNTSKVLTYDMRGNGLSNSGSVPVTISLLAEDLLYLLDGLGIQRAVVVGYSNGGAIAQEFALAYPDRTRGLVLIGGFPEVNTELLKMEFLLGISISGFGGLPLLAAGISKAHAPNEKIFSSLYDSFIRTDPYILHQMYKKTFHYKSTDRLHTLACPLLLVYGAKDHYIHSYDSLFKMHVKNTVSVYISGAKHEVPTKNPAELNAILRRFMEKLEQQVK